MSADEKPDAKARNLESRVRPLPTHAGLVDAALAQLDGEIDWLQALSPIHNDALWAGFRDSGYQSIAPLEYCELDIDLTGIRERLIGLPMDQIESPLLAGLLSEKQRELERQLALVQMCGTDGFITASLDLFGSVKPPLLKLADQILATVPVIEQAADDAGIDEVLAAVEDDLHWYREQSPDFSCEVVVDDDLNSMMMVSHGRFHINGKIRLPQSRVQPLIQHEIGTHVLTRHNGRHQALRQLEVGLAHYDPLQEGLGVLAEYLAGYLPGERLRILAARVVACEMAIHGEGVPTIFDLLHNTHQLPMDDAFDVAVRALRGGGLTKDAVYLSGLRDLIDYLHDDGEFEALFIGKFALSHRVVLDQLIDEGWAIAPRLLPRYFNNARALDRLAECRSLSVVDLYQKEPLE